MLFDDPTGNFLEKSDKITPKLIGSNFNQLSEVVKFFAEGIKIVAFSWMKYVGVFGLLRYIHKLSYVKVT